MPTQHNRAKIVYCTLPQYQSLNQDADTIYFIESTSETLIAIGDKIFANYVPFHCTGITLNKDTHRMRVGDQFLLTATTEPIDTSDEIVWTTNNPGVTLTDGGSRYRKIVQGVSEGTSVVTATCGEYSASCTFTISNVTLEEHILAENYSPNGAKFIYTAPIYLRDGQYIEVSIDVSGVTGTKENILGIGQSIDKWSAAGSGPRIQMYLTASDKSALSTDLINNTLFLRPTYALSGTTLIVRLDESGLWLNGSLYLFNTPPYRATPTLDYDVGMSALLSLTTFSIGSQEGSNRSHATYNYIKYYVWPE